MSQKDPSQTEEETPPQTGKNALEWTIFALSSLLVVGTLGWLGYQAVTEGNRPPRVEITLGEPIKAGARTLVPVRVENRGDDSAENVEIEVERQNSDETGSFALTHLPKRGTRQGWVAFDGAVEKSELKAGVKGFEGS